jgi:predicted hotdog family 3-hydroxylacyl-ACP dehydratase
MSLAAPFDHAQIAMRIPHAGSMCLLAHCEHWDEREIVCSATSHRDPGNPLRSDSGLLAPAAIEYAAQAMALHGALVAPPGHPPAPGYLASVRGVRLLRPRLDDAPTPLQVRAERLAGDVTQILYRFSVSDGAGELLAEGRATVVLNTPLDLDAAKPAA